MDVSNQQSSKTVSIALSQKQVYPFKLHAKPDKHLTAVLMCKSNRLLLCLHNVLLLLNYKNYLLNLL